jgi:hypothetical protein
MSGFMDMVGFGDAAQEELTGPGRAGVVLSGLYKNPATVITINFSENEASIGACGKLVDDSRSYTIDKRPGETRITLANEPNPIILTMRPDGGLTGPGLIDVKGRIIVGYFTDTHYHNGVATGTTRTPDYRPAMARCVIGSFAMPPAPKADPAPAHANDSSMMGIIGGLANTIAPGNGEVGLRMTGKYSDGRLLLDFTGNMLVLDCGQAHARQLYTVENTPNAFLVHVQNSGGPFSLALQPDNSLRGAGSTAINGRLVTGMNGDDVAFAPHSESCELGTFRPKTGSAAATSVANATPAPAPVATAGSISTIAGGAGVKLAIDTSFPSAKNPLAGGTVFLMSDRFDSALRKAGAPIPADATPGKALQMWTANCLPPKDCKALVTAMHQYYLAKIPLDGAGKSTLTAPVSAGSYFVFGGGRSSDGGLVWDVPITLKAGENTITLSVGNAELIP